MDFVTKFEDKMNKLAFEGQAPIKGTELMKNDWSQYGHMLPIALPAATGAMNAMFDNRDNANPVGDFVRGALPMAALAYGAHRYFGAPNPQQQTQPTDTGATTTGAQPGPQAAQPTTGTVQPVDANAAGGTKGKKKDKKVQGQPGDENSLVEKSTVGGASGLEPARKITVDPGKENKTPLPFRGNNVTPKPEQSFVDKTKNLISDGVNTVKNYLSPEVKQETADVKPVDDINNTINNKQSGGVLAQQQAINARKSLEAEKSRASRPLKKLWSANPAMLPDYHEKYAFYKQQAFNVVLQEQGLMPREKTASEQYKSIKLAAFIDQWQRKANMR